MADARDRAEWQRTAWLICHVLSAVDFSEEPREMDPGDFNPYVLAARQRAEGQRSPGRKGDIPYDPRILQSLQDSYNQLRGIPPAAAENVKG